MCTNKKQSITLWNVEVLLRYVKRHDAVLDNILIIMRSDEGVEAVHLVEKRLVGGRVHEQHVFADTLEFLHLQLPNHDFHLLPHFHSCELKERLNHRVVYNKITQNKIIKKIIIKLFKNVFSV